jgi:chemotaxis response regulator CheB
MPRRRRTNSGRRPGGSRTRSNTSRNRKASTRPSNTVQTRSRDIRRSVKRPSRRIRTEYRRKQEVSPGRAKRRTVMSVRKRRTTTRGLPHGLVPARTHHEDASSRKTAGVCRKAKEARRAVIIATGHGGKNGVQRYRKRKSCR